MCIANRAFSHAVSVVNAGTFLVYLDIWSRLLANAVLPNFEQ